MNNFLHAPFFMVRSPMLPTEFFFEFATSPIDQEKILELFFNHQAFKEAVYVASPNFYFEALKVAEKPDSEKKKIVQSLLKFLIRMSTRPTPFGLFSSVGFGEFSQSIDITIQSDSKHLKYVRSDMQYIQNYIKNMESISNDLLSLNLKLNDAVVESGSYIINYFYRDFNTRVSNDLDIKKNAVTQHILEITEDWISSKELLKQLLEKFPQYEEKDLINFLLSLVSKDILITNLNPSPFTTNPLKNLQENLKGSNKEGFFDPIVSAFQDANTKGVTLEKLKSLERKLREAYPSYTHKTALQVDSAFLKSFKLPTSVGLEAAKAFEFMYKVNSIEKDANPLDEYYLTFLDRYGEGTLLPFLEVIDEKKGLGIPNTTAYTNRTTSEKKEAWNNFITNKILLAITKGEPCLELHDQDLKPYLPDNFSYDKAPFSSSIFCSFISDRPEEIEQGKFNLILSPIRCCDTATGTFGRFLHLFSEEVNSKIETFSKLENEFESDTELVELSWLPPFGGAGNVSLHKNYRNYKLNLPPLKSSELEKEFLSLRDVFISVSEGKFVLYSKKLRKKIRFTSSNALNFFLSSRMIRILKSLSDFRFLPMNAFHIEALESFSYLPSIKHSKTYISPRMWKLDIKGCESKASSRKKYIREFLDEWNVPRYFFGGVSDNYLALDRECELHIEILSKELFKNSYLNLFERLEFEAHGRKERHYSKEFVIPILKKQNELTKKPNKAINTFVDYPKTESVSNNWFYFKLYFPKENQDKFLLEHVAGFMSKLINHKLISHWFFIRYTDSLDHIRLRLYKPDSIQKDLFSSLFQWAKNMKNTGEIRDFSFHDYQREVHRYGDESLIPYAEQYFFEDSMCTVVLLNLLKKKVVESPKEVIASIGILNLLLELDLDFQKIQTFLVQKNLNNVDVSGFRKHKPDIIKFCQNHFLDNLNNQIEDPMQQAFSLRRASLKDYIFQLKQRYGSTSEFGYSVYHSLIHMFCNRLGLDNQTEKKARFYALKAAKTLANFQVIA